MKRLIGLAAGLIAAVVLFAAPNASASVQPAINGSAVHMCAGGGANLCLTDVSNGLLHNNLRSDNSIQLWYLNSTGCGTVSGTCRPFTVSSLNNATTGGLTMEFYNSADAQCIAILNGQPGAAGCGAAGHEFVWMSNGVFPNQFIDVTKSDSLGHLTFLTSSGSNGENAVWSSVISSRNNFAP
jgi:hypothetical protein